LFGNTGIQYRGEIILYPVYAFLATAGTTTERRSINYHNIVCGDSNSITAGPAWQEAMF
jgi:hypothetical protein